MLHRIIAGVGVVLIVVIMVVAISSMSDDDAVQEPQATDQSEGAAEVVVNPEQTEERITTKMVPTKGMLLHCTHERDCTAVKRPCGGWEPVHKEHRDWLHAKNQKESASIFCKEVLPSPPNPYVTCISEKCVVIK